MKATTQWINDLYDYDYDELTICTTVKTWHQYEWRKLNWWPYTSKRSLLNQQNKIHNWKSEHNKVVFQLFLSCVWHMAHQWSSRAGKKSPSWPNGCNELYWLMNEWKCNWKCSIRDKPTDLHKKYCWHVWSRSVTPFQQLLYNWQWTLMIIIMLDGFL